MDESVMMIKAREHDFAKFGNPGTLPVDVGSRIYLEGEYADNKEILLQVFRERMNEGVLHWQSQWVVSSSDKKFLYESQWDSNTKAERERLGRPALEINIAEQFIDQVIGMVRNNRWQASVHSSTPYEPLMLDGEGERIKSCEVMEGILRYVESRNNSMEVVARAFRQAVDGGMGFIKVRTQVMPEDVFGSEIIVEHIPVSSNVVYDPYAMKEDFSDAEWVSVVMDMPVAEFEVRYGRDGKNPPRAEFFNGYGHDLNEWWTKKNCVKVCEYYFKKKVVIDVYKLSNAETGEEIVLRGMDKGNNRQHGVDRRGDLSVLDETLKLGYELIDERFNVETTEVWFMRCTANEILEEPVKWLGLRLPVVPVFGKTMEYGGRVWYHSLVHNAHDTVRMTAYWMSATTERVGNAARQKWLLEERMLGSHQRMWDNINKSNVPYIIFSDSDNSGQKPHLVSGEAFGSSELQLVEKFMELVNKSIGLHEANLGEASNEVSGVAIKRRQDAGANAVTEIVDAVRNSVRAISNIVMEIAPKVYSRGRAQNILLANGSSRRMLFNFDQEDKETGKVVRLNQLGNCRFNCTIIVDPGYQSQRAESLRLLMEFAQQNPTATPFVLDKIMEVSGLPNSAEMSKRLIHAVPPQALTDEEKTAAGIDGNQPTVEQQVDQKKAEAEIKSATSKEEIAALNLEKARVDLQRAQADGAEGGGATIEEMRKIIIEDVKKMLAEQELSNNVKK